MDENHLDLSETGLLNPVKDQGKAGNCYAQVACLTAEYEYKKGPIAVGIPWIEEMGAVRDEIYEGPNDVGAFFEKVYDDAKRKYKYKLVGGHGLVVIRFGDGKVDGRKVSYWLLQNSHGVGWGVNGVGKFSVDIKDPWNKPLIEKGYDPRKIRFPGQQKGKRQLVVKEDEREIGLIRTPIGGRLSLAPRASKGVMSCVSQEVKDIY